MSCKLKIWAFYSEKLGASRGAYIHHTFFLVFLLLSSRSGWGNGISAIPTDTHRKQDNITERVLQICVEEKVFINMSKYKKLCVSFMSWQKTVPPNQTVFTVKDKKNILPTGKTFWQCGERRVSFSYFTLCVIPDILVFRTKVCSNCTY